MKASSRPDRLPHVLLFMVAAGLAVSMSEGLGRWLILVAGALVLLEGLLLRE
jgi:hypothetical protein